MNVPIRAKAIVEILGSPKEHVAKTLAGYVAMLKKSKAQTINAAEIAEPELRDELWTAFVDLDITFPDADTLVGFCFESMPSSIDIIEPQNITFESGVFSGLLNDLQAHLHSVDMGFKQLTVEKSIVDRNAMHVLHNFVRHLVKDSPKDAAAMGPIIGLTPEKLQPFLNEMVEKGRLARKGDKFSLP
jgi:hypothetical protein